jgi:hypothetical protein
MIRATVLLFSHRPHGNTKSIIIRRKKAAVEAAAAAVKAKAMKEEGIMVRNNQALNLHLDLSLAQ